MCVALIEVISAVNAYIRPPFVRCHCSEAAIIIFLIKNNNVVAQIIQNPMKNQNKQTIYKEY